MKRAVFDNAGFALAFYAEDVNDDVPAGAVEISDEQWLDLVQNAGTRRWNGSNVVSVSVPQPPTAPVITSAVTFWKRTTDTEAEIIKGGIDALSAKKQGLVRAAKDFWSTDDYYPELRGFLVQKFGEARANELLAPSV